MGESSGPRASRPSAPRRLARTSGRTSRKRLLPLGRSTLLCLLVALLLLPPIAMAARPAEREALAFMQWLCGTWLGAGVADGTRVKDELVVALSPDRRSLTATSRAIAGDGFEAMMEMTYSLESGRFIAKERNNGRWPMRHFDGQIDGSTLHLHEAAQDRKVRLSITPRGQDSLLIQEASARGASWAPPFVSMQYQRVPSPGRCVA